MRHQLKKAGKVMRRMGRRTIANKFIMILIILVLLGAIGLIIFLKFYDKSK